MMRWLLDLLYPPKCVLCHKILPNSRQSLCDSCGRFVLAQKTHTRQGHHFTRCVAPLPYEEPVRGSIHRFKFVGRKFYAKTYGPWLAAVIGQEFDSFDVLTWVPISRKRLKKRGYDQSKLLAEQAGALLGVEPVQCLRKLRNNPPQSRSRSREQRSKNVAGAYACAADVADKRILLIDDVITTGATLEECSRILRRAGAKEVFCAVLAARN